MAYGNGRRRSSVRAQQSSASDAVTTTMAADAAATKPGIKPVDTLSAKVRKAIAALRTPFTHFVVGYGDMLQTRAELAPKFMAGFKAWTDETEGSFIEFVRVFDASVPQEREKYRNNATYQAATYLQRLTVAKGRRKKARGPKPATPFQAVAILAATLLPVVENSEMLWAAFLKELHWTKQQVARLQAAAGAIETPLLVKQGQERKLHLPKAA